MLSLIAALAAVATAAPPKLFGLWLGEPLSQATADLQSSGFTFRPLRQKEAFQSFVILDRTSTAVGSFSTCSGSITYVTVIAQNYDGLMAVVRNRIAEYGPARATWSTMYSPDASTAYERLKLSWLNDRYYITVPSSKFGPGDGDQNLSSGGRCV